MTPKTFASMSNDDIREGMTFMVTSDEWYFLTINKTYTITSGPSLDYPWKIMSDDKTSLYNRKCEWAKDLQLVEPEAYLPTLPFSILNGSHQSVLLLAKMNGTRIQKLRTSDGTWEEYTGAIMGKDIYRLTPKSVIDAEKRRKQVLSDISNLQIALCIA